ncbi:hypothetical protein VTK56DRAFT_9710 [Thermocarpiscus australiensis]
MSARQDQNVLAQLASIPGGMAAYLDFLQGLVDQANNVNGINDVGRAAAVLNGGANAGAGGGDPSSEDSWSSSSSDDEGDHGSDVGAGARQQQCCQ